MVMRKILHLYSIISKNSLPLSNHEKYIRQTKIEGHPKNILPSTPQNCQNHEK